MRWWPWWAAPLALLSLWDGDINTAWGLLPLRPTPEQRPPSDLNFDAQLVVESMDILGWYMGHDSITLAHLAMALLEGARLDTAREVIHGCGGDFAKVRGTIKSVLIRLPRAPITVPLGEAKVSPAVIEVFLRAHRMAEAEHSQTGIHHVFLALLHSPAFYNILVESGCDIDTFKRGLVVSFNRSPMPGTSASTASAGKDFDLSQYGEDLTEKARKGKLSPVIGRDEEIDRIAQILSRLRTKAPLMLGEPGVGKTAVIEGLALRVVEGTVPKPLRGRRIFSLDLLNLSAGTSMRGEFEKRMKDIISYLQQHKKSVILFVDEIHTLVGAGKTSGSADATQALKVPLARGDIVLVGATTLEEYKLHIEKDPAFCRRFQQIVVEAPRKERAMSILIQVKGNYEKFHNVTISEEVVGQIINLSDRYVKRRHFPDKALDLMDESCSWKRVAYTKKLNILKQKIAETERGGSSVSTEDLEKMNRELQELEALTAGGKRLEVTVHDVASVLSIWTGIPMGRMTEDEVTRVLKLADTLSVKVVGQYQAVKAVADAIIIQRAGLNPTNKPVGTFMFLGSSGVGKTELAKAIAEEMFESEKNIIRLDMVEFQEAHSISRIVGSPPGYMGNDEGGQLTEAVRQKPHSVVLFDEVENAHKNLWSLLLPMLDEGHLSDSKGVRVDFTNTLIILTSNIGQQFILDGYKEARALSEASAKGDESPTTGDPKSSNWKAGIVSPKTVLARMRQKVLKEVYGYFKPQVIGRMSEIIIFEPLNNTAMKGVLGLKLDGLIKSLANKGVDFKVSESAIDYILERAWSYKYGGRRIGKYLEEHILPKLSPLLLSKRLKKGDRAVLVRAKTNPNQLNLVVCELGLENKCKPGTKFGTKLIAQEAKASMGKNDEEEDDLMADT